MLRVVRRTICNMDSRVSILDPAGSQSLASSYAIGGRAWTTDSDNRVRL